MRKNINTVHEGRVYQHSLEIKEVKKSEFSKFWEKKYWQELLKLLMKKEMFQLIYVTEKH